MKFECAAIANVLKKRKENQCWTIWHEIWARWPYPAQESPGCKVDQWSSYVIVIQANLFHLDFNLMVCCCSFFFGCMTCLKLTKFITSRRDLSNIKYVIKKSQKFLRNLCHKKDMSLELLIKDAHIMTPAFRIPKERQYKASMYEFEKCWGPFKASW